MRIDPRASTAILATALLSLATGLAGADQVRTSGGGVGGLLIHSPIPLASTIELRPEVEAECKVGEMVPNAVLKAAGGLYQGIRLSPDVTPRSDGLVLVMKLIALEHEGIKGKTERRTAMQVAGRFYNSGSMLGNFVFYREANVKKFRPFTDDCEALEKSATLLGKDIAIWLRHPTKIK